MGEQRDDTLTVGTSNVNVSVDIAPGFRELIVLTNTSTGGQIITLGIGKDAVSKSGIVLYPGATYMEALDNSFTPTQKMIRAVSDLAGGSLSIHERTR